MDRINSLKSRLKREKPADRDKEYKKLGKSLESIIEGGYINHRRVYWVNFARGIFFGLGTFLGGTFFVAFLIWFLSLFGEVPFVGDFVDTLRETVD